MREVDSAWFEGQLYLIRRLSWMSDNLIYGRLRVKGTGKKRDKHWIKLQGTREEAMFIAACRCPFSPH